MIYQIDDQLRFGGTRFETLKSIPTGVWMLMEDGEFYLQKQKDFIYPDKIYGDEEKITDRYLNTFKLTNKNTGVLLSGLKGSGKTFRAKLTCCKSNLPVICINQPFVGDKFVNFLNSIDQKVIVFIDEFEKVYKEREVQEQLLPIFDGVIESQLMFLLTSNGGVSEFFMNRTGRIRYFEEFSGLEDDVVDQVIEDLLEDKSMKTQVLDLTYILGTVSVDILSTLLEEMNLYKISPLEAVQFLNIQIEHSYFTVRAYIGGKKYDTSINYNPIVAGHIYFSYTYTDDKGRERTDYYSQPNDHRMKKEIGKGQFRFADSKGNEIVFIPSKPFKFKIDQI